MWVIMEGPMSSLTEREPEPVRCPSFNIKLFSHIYSDATLSNFYLAIDIVLLA